ncbi:MAG: recombination protein RecR [Planctomycetes bacterium]|nr:recombination protein RecR [Planctomycetota bacterium]
MSHEFAEPLSRLIEEFARLPGVGQRTAERLAYHVLKVDRESAMGLARAIRDVKDRLRACRRCFNIADGELCAICSSDSRDNSIVCVVESARDLIAIEKSGAYRGLYHVLSGRVSPHEGQGADRTTLAALLDRLDGAEATGIKEILVATNPNAEGDTTALVIEEHLRGRDLKLTRLARGLPSGGTIEFANVDILRDAIDGRAGG